MKAFPNLIKTKIKTIISHHHHLHPIKPNPRKTLINLHNNTIITTTTTTIIINMQSWTCTKCTFINPHSLSSTCQVCLSSSLSSTSSSSQWSCKSCTFLNPITKSKCEVCGSRACSLSLSSTIEVDDDDLVGSGVGSVFLPLMGCSKRKSRDDIVEVLDDDGEKVQVADDGCDEKKRRFSGLKSEKEAVSLDENSSKSESKTLKVLSYNVWFREDLEMHRRMGALGNLIQRHSPDFICMQEVTPDIYNIFQQSAWWSKYYCSVTTDMAMTRGYFCMQLSKLQVKSFSCKPFHNSVMGRELCIAEIQVQKTVPLVIATSHLESPCPAPPKWDQMYSKQRVQQANNAMELFKQKPNVIFCGDMNWDDKLDGLFPLPDGWFDAWVKLRPQENGYTYDTKSNLMISGNKALQKRLDRFVCKLQDFDINSIEMIGMEAIPGLSYIKEKRVKKEVRKLELPVLPSDHYGLLLTISPR